VSGPPNIATRHHALGQLEAGGLRVSTQRFAKAVAVAAAQLLSGRHGQAQREAVEGQAAHAEYGHVATHAAQVPRGPSSVAA